MSQQEEMKTSATGQQRNQLHFRVSTRSPRILWQSSCGNDYLSNLNLPEFTSLLPNYRSARLCDHLYFLHSWQVLCRNPQTHSLVTGNHEISTKTVSTPSGKTYNLLNPRYLEVWENLHLAVASQLIPTTTTVSQELSMAGFRTTSLPTRPYPEKIDNC